MRRGSVLAGAAALWLAAAPSAAHKPSDSYLQLALDGAAIQGRWDIALRDLEHAVGLDADGDGAITWGELRGRHDAIAAYALARLRLGVDGHICHLRPGEQLVDRHTDGAYSVLTFTADCPAGTGAVTIEYRLFSDLDPQHRGLIRFDRDGETRSLIFGPDAAVQTVAATGAGLGPLLVEYLREGVRHIWRGYDHLLFLFALLLPAVLRWEAGRWRAAASLRAALAEVVQLVTAFTLSHSITLGLAALGAVAPPARLVEAAIAGSVIASALNNIWPVVRSSRWSIAFAFGLIHGFGFAAVLTDLGLPRDARVVALLGFNLGVEAGQLALVAAVVPPLFVLRRLRWYPSAGLAAGSAAIAIVAALWFTERLLGVTLLGS